MDKRELEKMMDRYRREMIEFQKKQHIGLSVIREEPDR